MTQRIYIFGGVIILALTALVFAFSQKTGRVPGTPLGGAACTMEALLCPDGSGVGREGSRCVFRPCPQTPSFIGKLEMNTNGFRLIVPSPKEFGQDSATYAIPLTTTATSTLSPLVGKNVRVYGSFVEGSTYAVDRVESFSPNDPQSDASRGVVGIGETKLIAGVKITLHAVVGDYRCPVDVQCIEAGAITASVTLRSDTDSETFNMPSDEVPHAFDSYQVSITEVAPPLLSTQQPDPSAYRVTFKVEPLKQ